MSEKLNNNNDSMIILLFLIMVGINIYILFFHNSSTREDKRDQKMRSTKFSAAELASSDMNMLFSTSDGNIDVVSFEKILPKRSIISWSPADVNNIVPPAGWAVCNGQNGTPDLRGRFILGHNPSNNLASGNDRSDGNNIGGSGGERNVTLTVGQMPKHSHGIDTGSGTGHTNGDRVDMYSNNSDINMKTGIVKEAGNNESHNNIPPYLVLVYIMKL